MKFALILMLLSSVVFAGNEGGNGGDGIYCPESTTASARVVLLDYFEMNDLVLGPSSNEWEKVSFVLKRMARVNPNRARLYEEGLKNFLFETKFVRGTRLPDIPDQGNVAFPRKCELRQLAIQETSYYFGENYHSWNTIRPGRYTIDADLWDLMDADSKAGLILHELIYREGANIRQHKNSRMVREMNRLLSSYEMEGIPREEYNSKVLVLGFGVVDQKINDFLLPVSHYNTWGITHPTPPVFHANGNVAKVVLDGYAFKGERKFSLKEATFQKDGKLQTLSFNDEWPSDTFLFGERAYQFKGKVRFEDDIVDGQITNEIVLTYKGDNLVVAGTVTASEQGEFFGGTILAPLQLKSETYSLDLISGSVLRLDRKTRAPYLVTKVTGEAFGSGIDRFKFNGGQIFFTHTGRVGNVHGGVTGEVAACQGSKPLWKTIGKFMYNHPDNKRPWFIEELEEPLKCLGTDNKIYDVQYDITLNSLCQVSLARDLPWKVSSCVIQ